VLISYSIGRTDPTLHAPPSWLEEKIHRLHLVEDLFGLARQVTSVERILIQYSLAAVLEERMRHTSIFDVEEEAPPSLKKHLSG